MSKIDSDGNIIEGEKNDNIKNIFDISKSSESKGQVTSSNPFGTESTNSQPNFNSSFMNDESQVVNSLLNDNNVPLDSKRKYWWVFSRDNSLTFLDEKRKKDKMINFDIIKIDTLNALTYYDYTFEIEKEMNIMRNAIEVKFDRALGTTKTNQLNERIAQKSQFNETRQINKDEGGSKNGSFIGKLLNRR